MKHGSSRVWVPLRHFWTPFWRPFETFLQESLTRCAQFFKDLQDPFKTMKKAVCDRRGYPWMTSKSDIVWVSKGCFGGLEHLLTRTYFWHPSGLAKWNMVLQGFECLWDLFWDLLDTFLETFETFLQESLIRCAQFFNDLQGPIQNHEKGCL